MKQAVLCLLAVAALAGGCVTTRPAAERDFVQAKNKVLPALVHVRPVKEVYTAGTREEMVVVGSGFIISPDGYVITNEHVAGESKSVRCVLSSQEEMDAEVVGTDRYTDIAVLKLKTDRKDLPTVKLGHSSALEAGQLVLALGSPLGLSRSVSMGIVSVPNRYLGEGDDPTSLYYSWIQTDAAINRGNSGGPLVNLRGEVVGVNARRLNQAENVGFAIPIDTVREVMEQIRAKGRVQRSWLGVNFQEMTSITDDPSRKGVVISDVDPLSPAFDAQVKPGDILLNLDGLPTNARYEEELPALNKLIADLPVGQEVTLNVERAGKPLELKMKTVEKADVKGEELEFPAWGFTASSVTPAIMRRAQAPSLEGVFVIGVQVGGPAGNAQLREGDIILRVDTEPVPDMATFRKLYGARVEARKPLVLLDVKRGALARYVLIKQEPGAPAAGAAPVPAGQATTGGPGNAE